MSRDWASEVLSEQNDPQGGLVQVQVGPGSRNWTDEILRDPNTPQAQKQNEPRGGLLKRLGAAVVGKHDASYASIPAFDDASAIGLTGVAKTAFSKIAGADDAQYGDTIQKSLGDRFIRRIKDSNGYELIEYRGDDGKPVTRYVNKPGLDMDDVSRSLMGIVPYAFTAAKAANVLKNTGMLARGAGQAATAAGTSLAADASNTAVTGARFDPVETGKKAALTGVLGGAAELLPSKVLMGTLGAAGGAAVMADHGTTTGEYASGSAIGAIAGYGTAALLKRMMVSPGTWIKPNGDLTTAGEKLVVSQGLDPATMSAAARQEFARTYGMSRDATEAAVRSGAADFNIPSTVGQRTKDPQQLMREKAYRHGIYGEEPKGVITQFDKEQADAVRGAVLGRQVASGQTPAQPGIGQMINPDTWLIRDPGSRGEAIRSGVSIAKDVGKSAESEAWKKVGSITSDDVGMAVLPQEIRASLSKSNIPINENTPNAMTMIQRLEDFKGGQSPGPKSAFLPNMTTQDVDQIRRQLGAMSRGAQTDTDRAASKAVAKAYNDWIGTASARGLISGDVAALNEARQTSASWKNLFAPLENGRPSPGAARIKAIINESASPEEIVAKAVGDVTVRATPQSGSLEAISSIKTILTRMVPGRGDAAATRQAAQTWNEIRSAYWERAVLGKNGEILSPNMLLNNLRMMRNNQGSVVRELFTPQERLQMARLERVLETISYKDPNPSGTATGLGVLGRDLVETISNALQGFIPTSIGKAAAGAVIAPLKRQSDKAGARAAIDQTVRERLPSLGPYGAAAGSVLDDTRN